MSLNTNYIRINPIKTTSDLYRNLKSDKSQNNSQLY